MEVIEDGNIMDRIPILLQRDLEYYQKNQTVLSETICRGVVGGRLDFPRNASFASVKIVLWLEEEFSIAFQQGSGMFVVTEEDGQGDSGVAKTSDPDKFVQSVIKSSDALLEHLHVVAQEALDHADLPVLTATLGAAALLKNTLYCYVHKVEDTTNSERHSLLQGCYKRFVTMSEAVGERVLDLHNRVLSLYILQDAGGRPIEGATTPHAGLGGTPSVQGWWLYMNGSRKDLWDTVPPRMAQRIFAGMLNETLTILTVRYCQTKTTESSTSLLLNDIFNILYCVAELLPGTCSSGGELAGLGARAQPRDVRDVHAKCNELFKCAVYRGAEPHFIVQAFKEQQESGNAAQDSPCPWFTFVSPKLFDKFDDVTVKSTQDLPVKTALGLDLIVMLAQPQPSWPLLVKVVMMRGCHLARLLLVRAARGMARDNARWPASGLWYAAGGDGANSKCGGFLCTPDGYCKFQPDHDGGQELARAMGALTYVVASLGSRAELASTLCYALELSARDWAACLDKRQVWCDRRPAWLAGLLALAGSALRFVPAVLVGAVQAGASIYQTMSLCLTCISRSLECVPRCLVSACGVLQRGVPARVTPVGGSVLLQLLVTLVYDETLHWARREAAKETPGASTANGEPHTMAARPGPRSRSKQVRIQTTSTSLSFDSSHSSPSSIALAIAEALCSIDEDDKHTQEIQKIIAQAKQEVKLSNQFGLEDFPEFAELFQQGDVPGSGAERASDAAALTSQILMKPAGRDSLRVIYEHIKLHADWIYSELQVADPADADIPVTAAPLLYTMFHIGRRPFDQYLRNEVVIPWSAVVGSAVRWWGRRGARAHLARRRDVCAARCNNTRHALCTLLANTSSA